jgi:putative ABC transport system permease protein
MTLNLRVSLRDLAHEALSALLAHRLRTALSAIGIVFGIATVVTAVAIGEGARHAALSEIGALGINNVFVHATAAPPVMNGRQRPPAPVLSLEDVSVMADTIERATAIAAARVAPGELTVGSRHTAGALVGVTPSWRTVVDADIAVGRWLSAADERSRRRVAVIGGRLTRELFAAADPVGSRVLAGGNWYLVVGMLRERSAGSARPAIQSVDLDGSLVVPLSAMDVTLGDGDSPDRVQEIAVRVSEAADVNRTAQAVSALLARRHTDARRYELVVPIELLRARLRAQRSFNVVLVAIGALALIISGIGIMNIMLASVVERTQEIGVRRAFGARRAEILAQFAIEAAALCVAGGVVGVLVGVGLSGIVALAAGWPVNVSIWAVLLALALACGVGLAFGIYPARLAAGIQPIDALRAT